MKARVFVKYFVYDSHCKDFFASNSPQAPLNLIRLKILVTLRPLTQYLLKT